MFDACLKKTLAHEGGLSNHPADKGGKTKWGITAKTARQHGYSIDTLAKKEMEVIYHSYYTASPVSQIQSISDCYQPIVEQAFDMSVNHGHRNATRIIQKAIGTKSDGIWGKDSRKALMSCVSIHGVAYTNARIVLERIKFYEAIIRRTPSQAVFRAGWHKRAMAFA